MVDNVLTAKCRHCAHWRELLETAEQSVMRLNSAYGVLGIWKLEDKHKPCQACNDSGIVLTPAGQQLLVVFVDQLRKAKEGEANA